MGARLGRAKAPNCARCVPHVSLVGFSMRQIGVNILIIKDKTDFQTASD
jgi:hypothetical protein